MPERFNTQFWERLDQLIDKTQVIVDRPKDSTHPDFEDVIYPLDYGYLAGTTSSDGAGIDVWMGASGSKKVMAIVCTVDLLKQDSEVKILMGCTEEEMIQALEFLNDSESMGGLLIRRME